MANQAMLGSYFDIGYKPRRATGETQSIAVAVIAFWPWLPQERHNAKVYARKVYYFVERASTIVMYSISVASFIASMQ